MFIHDIMVSYMYKKVMLLHGMRKYSIGKIFFDGPFSQVLSGVWGGGRARVKFDESLQNFL